LTSQDSVSSRWIDGGILLQVFNAFIKLCFFFISLSIDSL
jgi:hypothetical protein